MTTPKAENITWHASEVTQAIRAKAHGHDAAVLWLTGLSGSGKSTIARRVEQRLLSQNVFVYVLDGDNLRYGLNADLGFSPEDRTENIRRVGEVTKLFADAGAVVIAAFISPYREDRARVRDLFERGEFIEVHIKADLETCEARDPKGLYRKARAGQIRGFTGIDAPYETPESPEIVVDSSNRSIEECADAIIAWLSKRGTLGTKAAVSE